MILLVIFFKWPDNDYKNKQTFNQGEETQEFAIRHFSKFWNKYWTETYINGIKE